MKKRTKVLFMTVRPRNSEGSSIDKNIQSIGLLAATTFQ